jgi:hypothetical protein
MSHETSIAAWQADVSGSTLLVLVALAEWCNPKGICYPSMARIAHRANISERHARRAVSELIHLGGITVLSGAKGGRGTRPLYRLTPEKLPQKAPFTADASEENPDVDVRVSERKGDTGVRVSAEKADMGGKKPGHGRPETRTPVVCPAGNLKGGEEPPLTTKNHQEDDEREGADAAAPRRSPSLVPNPFPISEEMRRQAESYGVPADAIDFETEKFVDKFTEKEDLKIDWLAAWRNWMRRVRDFGPRTPLNGAGPTSPGFVGRSAQAKSALDRMLELSQGD